MSNLLDPIERILITVRTYPNLSETYMETVCTGGINDCGQWRRLYPVSWRLLEEEKQYRTFDIVSVRLGTNPDGRLESRRPDATSIKVLGRIDDWRIRRDWIVPTTVGSMAEMKAANRTLAPVLVDQVLDFIADPVSPEWSDKQKELLRQGGLFGGPTPLEKIPFDFRLKWRDGAGEEHDSKFLDWEVGQTWRNYRHRYPDPLATMRELWMNKRFGAANDLWFFMGNFASHRQHYGVCGTFCPPKESGSVGNLFTN